MTAAPISRRDFFVKSGTAAAATAAAVTLAANPAFAQDKAETLATFALEPNGGACNACRLHAKNKVFGTKEAADTFRAHKGCRCTVIDGQQLSPVVYAAVFPEKNGAVDRRDPRIAELLDKGTVDGTPVPIVAYTAPVLLLAAGGGIWWFMKHRDKQVEPAAVVDKGDWK